MRILLDTHILIWFLNADKQLSKSIKTKIQDIENECFISVASLWEIAIKTSLGKLELEIAFSQIELILIENEIQILPISFQHLQHLHLLALHHRDPFDRIIIAQSLAENIPIATRDKLFSAYPAKIISK